MILLLNGAFGIGKTTVARRVRDARPHSIVLNPEPIGVVLQRSARLLGKRVDDFQDLALWRRLTIVAVRLARIVRSNVIVPMAFSNAAYLDEIRSALRRFDDTVLHVCLVAPLDVVHARLEARGAHPLTHAWEYRRAAECCTVHRGGEFAKQVRADGDAGSVADDVLALVGEAVTCAPHATP